MTAVNLISKRRHVLLETERLILRRYESDDLDRLDRLNSDAEVMRYYPKVLSRDESREWLERQFKQFPANLSFQSAEAENAELPSSPPEAAKALELLRKEELRIAAEVGEFNRLKSEIDDSVKNLYESRKSS